MKKVKGKALSLVLSLALVISSFSAIPASAATKTLNGSLGGNDNDKIYLVNGGADDAALTYESFGTYVSDDPTMTTPNHKDVSDVHIAAISHKSGDRLVKWYDAGSQHENEDSISEDTIDKYLDLQLRSATVSGEEVISLLYKGTYTDDDDNEYTVKATQDVTVRVYDKNEAVIGEYGDAGTSNSKGELDSSFAQKTVAYETSAKEDSDSDKTDSKELTVLKATSDPSNPVVVKWESLKTVSENDANADDYLDDDSTRSNDGTYYVLKSNSGNVVLGNGNQALSFSNESDPSATQPGLKLKVVNGAKTDTVVVSDPLNDYTFKYSVTHDGAEGTKAAVTGGKIDVSALDDGDTVKVYAYDGDDPVGTAASFTVVAASDAALAIASSSEASATENTTGATAAYDATEDGDAANVVVTDHSATNVKYAWGDDAAQSVTDSKIAIADKADGTLTITSTATDGTEVTNVYNFKAATTEPDADATLEIKSSSATSEDEDSTGATAAYDATEDGDAANVVVTDHSAINVKYAWGDDAAQSVTDSKIAIAGKADGTLTIQSTTAGKTITNVYTFTAATTDKTARSLNSVANYVSLSKNTDGDVVVSNDAATGYALTYSVNNVDKGAVSGKEITGLHNGDTLKVTATKGDTVLTTSGIFRAYAPDSSEFVTAQVDTKAGTGNVTFTAEATPYAETQVDADALYSASDIKVKSSVDKKILVGNSKYTTFSKYSTSTYLYTGPVDSKSKDDGVKVTGYEVNFNNSAAKVTVDDKANVTKISGTVDSITVSDGNVGSISLSDTAEQSVTVSDAKVGDIDFGSNGGTLEVNSTDSIVGNVTDASKVTVTNGTVGDIDADEADISAEDEDGTVKVGNVTAPIIGVDSDNSKVATGTLKATSDDTEITLSGDFVTVAGVDFDNWGAELKIDGFTGTVPAPKNATEDGATISTNATEDKVTIDGDADINSIAIGDDSQMIFNGKLNVGSVDGSGTLVVGLGKMDISSDASGVTLKFSDPTINVGDTAFTAVTDTVDVDSMEPYGCTLSMTEGSKEDTFKIASTDFVGMTFNPSSARIANGYSQTFAASTYAPGTALPEGYSVQYTLDGDDDIFQMTNNDDGTVTVKVVGYDDTFAEENTATLRAEVVDTDGDVDDDYSAGELDLTALAVPDATFKSDTGSTLNIGGGFTYQFAITSLDGNVPYFAVAGSSFKTTYVGNSGNTYYYKVTAVGKVGDAAGVYINHGATPSTVITITNPSDTAAVTVKAGNSYQFRVNGPSQPVFQVAGIGNIALTSKAGSNYYFKVNVPTNLAKGGHGVYNNGVLVAILTVA